MRSRSAIRSSLCCGREGRRSRPWSSTRLTGPPCSTPHTPTRTLENRRARPRMAQIASAGLLDHPAVGIRVGDLTKIRAKLQHRVARHLVDHLTGALGYFAEDYLARLRVEHDIERGVLTPRLGQPRIVGGRGAAVIRRRDAARSVELGSDRRLQRRL